MEPDDLEQAYQDYMQDLAQHIPDGIVDVDLTLLQELGLLTCEEEEGDSDALTHNFYVIETSEKLTLFNETFSVWIVPQMLDEAPATYTLIALNRAERPQLEMAFSTAGVYNHSSLVLRILEKFLEQIEENEAEICRIKQD